MSKNSKADELSSSEESFFEEDIDYGIPPVRPRQRFTVEEIQILENHFKENPRPTVEVKKALAIKFETVQNRIQVWFQNRRAKEKKITCEEKNPEKRRKKECPGPSTEPKKVKASLLDDRQQQERDRGLFVHAPHNYPGYPSNYSSSYLPHQVFLNPRQIDPGVNMPPYNPDINFGFRESFRDLDFDEEENREKPDKKGKKRSE